MESIAYANTFFLISSIGFIIIFLLVIVGLIYLIGLLKSIMRISLRIEKDIDGIGDTAKEFVVRLWDSALFTFIFGKKRKRKSID